MQVRKLLGLKYSSDEITLRILADRKNGLEGYTVWKHPKLSGSNLPLEPEYVHDDSKVELAKAVLTKRKNLNILKFVDRALTNMDEHHRVTARFSPHAISGRVQPSDENLSQYPRAMKSMWGINPEVHGDRVLIYADYSQLELRTICAILPERNMERAYRNKIDLHTFASKNLDIDESKLPKSMPKRTVAKYLNFLMLYGGGVANFQKTVCKNSGVFLELDICKQANDDWKAGFSDIKAWHEKNAKSKGHGGSTIGGRKYKAKSYTDLNNIQVQGSGTEVAKLAWSYIYKYNVVDNKDSFVVNFVHDAFVLDCPNDPSIYEPIANRLGMVMKLSWQEVMAHAPIKDLPMPVDVLVGRNWADLEYETDVMYRVTIDGDYDANLMKEFEDGAS
jgi:DNA polymerase I-like protein with 3'-5' exonuclease and polymerase domains